MRKIEKENKELKGVLPKNFARPELDKRRLGELTDADIAKISGNVDRFCEGKLKAEKGFCAAVSTEKISRQGYILTPGRYVGIAEEAAGDEPFPEKMTRLTTELRGLFSESHRLEKEIKKRLGAIGREV